MLISKFLYIKGFGIWIIKFSNEPDFKLPVPNCYEMNKNAMLSLPTPADILFVGPLLMDIGNKFNEFIAKNRTVTFNMYSGVSCTLSCYIIII